MLLLFGATEATLPYAMAYFTAYLLGTPFALMANGPEPAVSSARALPGRA